MWPWLPLGASYASAAAPSRVSVAVGSAARPRLDLLVVVWPWAWGLIVRGGQCVNGSCRSQGVTPGPSVTVQGRRIVARAAGSGVAGEDHGRFGAGFRAGGKPFSRTADTILSCTSLDSQTIFTFRKIILENPNVSLHIVSMQTIKSNQAGERTQDMTIYRQARAILTVCPDVDLRRAEQRISFTRPTLTESAWWEGSSNDRIKLAEAGLAPVCDCSACDCDEPAVMTDDGGNAVCEACENYTTGDDGEVLCSRCNGVETVVESCGAGNQTRSYLRQVPPVMPDADADGEYALYWDTAGDGSHVAARFATLAQAEQAVAAKDWPRPGDNTHYLCGWEARQLIDGEWTTLERI